MADTIALYIKNELFEWTEIKLPNHDRMIDFDSNVKLREECIHRAIEEMIMQYPTKIADAHEDFFFILNFESKLNAENFNDWEHG